MITPNSELPYHRWLSSLFRTSVKEGPQSPLPHELTLQSYWYRGAFGLDFTTTDGRSVKIHYLGEWNHTEGPDFLECLISIDGAEQKGAIELDLSVADWERHGHATNENFNQVILHVSFTETSTSTFCRTTENKEIPRIEIGQDLTDIVTEGKRDALPSSTAGYCSDEFASWSSLDIQRLIEAASEYRLSEKSRKLAHQVEAIGLRESLWQSLATTLGYRPNQDNLRLLSQRIKASTLEKHGDGAEQASLCLGTSGFLDVKHYESAPAHTQTYLKKLWDHWWLIRKDYELSAHTKISWKLSGMRPINHPQRRVATLPLLLKTLPKLERFCATPNEAGLKSVQEALSALEEPFWSYHYTLGSKTSAKKLSLFGEDKFHALCMNFLIPLWYLKDKQAAFSFYCSISEKSKNSQVSKTIERLFIKCAHPDQFTKRSYQHQGLQQLYQDFCLQHGCLNCPFPRFSSYLSHSHD